MRSAQSGCAVGANVGDVVCHDACWFNILSSLAWGAIKWRTRQFLLDCMPKKLNFDQSFSMLLYGVIGNVRCGYVVAVN